MQAEDQLKALAKKLKPTEQDIKQYNNAVNAVSRVLDHTKILSKAEIWKCGSVGKGTAIRPKSDIDVVVLFSQKQTMNNVLDILVDALKGTSTTPPEILRRAVNITVHDVKMDVVPTQYDVKGVFSRALRSPREVAEIIEQGDLFKSTVRILKYWRDHPDNAPKTGKIPSFAIEVLVAKNFRINFPTTNLGALKKFFDYVVEDQLETSLGLHDGHGNTILTYRFDFPKKQFFIEQARHVQKMLRQSPPDLTFLGL